MRDFSLEHTVHVTVKQTTSIFKFAWAKFKWVFYLIYPKWQFLVKRNEREETDKMWTMRDSIEA